MVVYYAYFMVVYSSIPFSNSALGKPSAYATSDNVVQIKNSLETPYDYIAHTVLWYRGQARHFRFGLGGAAAPKL